MKNRYKNVYVIGVFDLFHRGHLEFLKKSKALGERLIVALNSDEVVSTYKRRPIFNENDRLELIKYCKLVDETFIINTFDNKQVIVDYQINAIIHGDDWDLESYKKQIRVDDEFLNKHNVDLVLVDYSKGISTSQIINDIKESD
jgi:cytidyltransferase-like protein